MAALAQRGPHFTAVVVCAYRATRVHTRARSYPRLAGRLNSFLFSRGSDDDESSRETLLQNASPERPRNGTASVYTTCRETRRSPLTLSRIPRAVNEMAIAIGNEAMNLSLDERFHVGRANNDVKRNFASRSVLNAIYIVQPLYSTTKSLYLSFSPDADVFPRAFPSPLLRDR